MKSIIPLFLSVSFAIFAQEQTPRDETLWREALRIHRAAIVVDGHNDITMPMTDNDYDISEPSGPVLETDLARLHQGGLTAQFFSIWVDPEAHPAGNATRRALEMIDAIYRATERHPAKLVFAASAEDIRRAKQEGKIAALLGVEGGHAIDNSLAALRAFHRLGVRYMTLTHNVSTPWAGATRDTNRVSGLSDFGREVVREMNRLGMLVDVSHVSDQTMRDAIAASRVPVIASHSSARALCDDRRNIPDDLLRQLGARKGVVMVNFHRGFLDAKFKEAETPRFVKAWPTLQRYRHDPRRGVEELRRIMDVASLPQVSVGRLVDHIEHIARVAGIECVGLGSDYDGWIIPPNGLEDVSKFPVLTYELLRRGFGEAELRKILGENLLRVLGEAEDYARQFGGTISGNGSRIKLEPNATMQRPANP